MDYLSSSGSIKGLNPVHTLTDLHNCIRTLPWMEKFFRVVFLELLDLTPKPSHLLHMDLHEFFSHTVLSVSRGEFCKVCRTVS